MRALSCAIRERTGASRGYFPQLDTLRALAVLLVLGSHFAPSVPLWFWHGDLGVRLFFTLSGFLITRILWDTRVEAGRTGVSIGRVLWRFYARRALRLLPLFYGVLLLAWLVDFGSVRATWPWHAFYASNVRFAVTGSWEPGLAHFWTLAVEEQFYFVWPLLILAVPRQRLRMGIISMVVVAPLFRTFGQPLGFSEMAVWTLPFGALDSLGLGALIALDERQMDRTKEGNWLDPLVWPAALTAASLVAVRLVFQDTPPTMFWLSLWSIRDLCWALTFAAMIRSASQDRPGLLRDLLQTRPLVYVGRISYGIYVIHAFTPAIVAWAIQGTMVSVPSRPGISFGVFTAVTIGLAALSWHLYEGPINALRRRLRYVPHPGPGIAVRSARGRTATL